MRALHASRASFSMRSLPRPGILAVWRPGILAALPVACFLLLGARPARAEPIPTASTHFLHFGQVPVGEQRVQPIEFGNDGDEPWTVDGLEFLGGQRFDFGVVQGLGGFVIPPGGHVVRDIVFTPAEVGIRAGYLHTITEFPIPELLVQVIGVGAAAAGMDGDAVAERPGLRLGPPTPNPARGRFSVEIEGVPGASAILAVFDPAGRLIRSLAGEIGPSRRARIEWDGRMAGGTLAPAGIYLLRAESGGEVAVRTAVLLR